MAPLISFLPHRLRITCVQIKIQFVQVAIGLTGDFTAPMAHSPLLAVDKRLIGRRCALF